MPMPVRPVAETMNCVAVLFALVTTIPGSATSLVTETSAHGVVVERPILLAKYAFPVVVAPPEMVRPAFQPCRVEERPGTCGRSLASGDVV